MLILFLLKIPVSPSEDSQCRMRWWVHYIQWSVENGWGSGRDLFQGTLWETSQISSYLVSTSNSEPLNYKSSALAQAISCLNITFGPWIYSLLAANCMRITASDVWKKFAFIH